MTSLVDFTGLTDDLAFKYVFSHQELLEDLFNSYLEYLSYYKEKIITVMPEAFMQALKKNKRNFYGDIVAINSKGNIYSIEMYNKYNLEQVKKSLSYMTRLYSNQLNAKESYGGAKKVTSLNFVKGNYLNKDNSLVRRYVLKNVISNEELEINNLEYVIIYLDQIASPKYNKCKLRFYKWLKFIKEDNMENLKKIAKGDKVMEQSLRYVQEFLSDPEIEAIYGRDNEKKREGIQEGIQEGYQESRNNMAIEMLKDKVNLKTIAKYTKLSLKEIKELQKNYCEID